MAAFTLTAVNARVHSPGLFSSPLPSEVSEKLDYLDQSVNVLFADGAARSYAPHYLAVATDGKSLACSRDRWREILTQRFKRMQEQGISQTRSTEHISFRWTGLSTLVQVVHVKKARTQSDGSSSETNLEIELTWRKERLGWFIRRLSFVREL